MKFFNFASVILLILLQLQQTHPPTIYIYLYIFSLFLPLRRKYKNSAASQHPHPYRRAYEQPRTQLIHMHRYYLVCTMNLQFFTTILFYVFLFHSLHFLWISFTFSLYQRNTHAHTYTDFRLRSHSCFCAAARCAFVVIITIALCAIVWPTPHNAWMPMLSRKIFSYCYCCCI